MAHLGTIEGKTVLTEIWHIDDVHAAAQDMDTTVTTEEAENILEAIANSHDCNIGINWEVFYYHIGMLKSQQDIAAMAQSVLDRKKGKSNA